MLWASLLTWLLLHSFASAAGPGDFRTVVVLYPDTDNASPGSVLVNRSIRAAFEAGSCERVAVHNEYLDMSRFREADYAQLRDHPGADAVGDELLVGFGARATGPARQIPWAQSFL